CARRRAVPPMGLGFEAEGSTLVLHVRFRRLNVCEGGRRAATAAFHPDRQLRRHSMKTREFAITAVIAGAFIGAGCSTGNGGRTISERSNLQRFAPLPAAIPT